MTLSDGTIRLRPWRPDDAAAIESIRDDPRLLRWATLPDGIDAWLEAQAARDRRISLAITEVGGDRALGRISLRVDGEIGYWVLPDARGRGLAARAVRLMAAHAREELGISELHLEIEPDNEPSLRVAAAVGARPTGERVTEVDRQGVERELLRLRL